MFTKTVTTKKSGVTYRNVYEALKGHVICGRDRCPDTGMQATGIPTHILIANQVSDLRDTVENKFSELSSTVTSLAESMNRRMDALECAMPNELFKMLMEHFKVDGVAPVNMADIQQLLDVRQQEILDRLEQILKQNAVGNGPVVSQISHTCNGSSSVSPRDSGVIYKYFSWGGKLRRLVPQGFIFPKVDVKTMWNLWYFGHSGQQIHPYKELCNFLDDLSSNRDKERYSRAKKVMSFLEDEMLTQNLLPDGVESIGALKAEEADRVFRHAYEAVVRRLYPSGKCQRMAELQCDTLANRVSLLKRKNTKGQPTIAGNSASNIYQKNRSTEHVEESSAHPPSDSSANVLSSRPTHTNSSAELVVRSQAIRTTLESSLNDCPKTFSSVQQIRIPTPAPFNVSNFEYMFSRQKL